MSTITRPAAWPAPTTDTGDTALRQACAERRIEALSVAILLLLDQAKTPQQRRAAALAREALDEVGLPHG
ncbi:hypothetical protein [Dactylosporangium sp. CA-233914]|uniref:hypothetical protein n=1 Tax=Dactylosporangium sp. CA-233914 TaxID=3239934 RepID=UPI003D940384